LPHHAYSRTKDWILIWFEIWITGTTVSKLLIHSNKVISPFPTKKGYISTIISINSELILCRRSSSWSSGAGSSRIKWFKILFRVRPRDGVTVRLFFILVCQTKYSSNYLWADLVAALASLDMNYLTHTGVSEAAMNQRHDEMTSERLKTSATGKLMRRERSSDLHRLLTGPVLGHGSRCSRITYKPRTHALVSDWTAVGRLCVSRSLVGVIRVRNVPSPCVSSMFITLSALQCTE